MTCHICRGETRTVLDLGEMPLANRLKDAPDAPEKRFPLAVEFFAGCGHPSFVQGKGHRPDPPGLSVHPLRLPVRRVPEPHGPIDAPGDKPAAGARKRNASYFPLMASEESGLACGHLREPHEPSIIFIA